MLHLSLALGLCTAVEGVITQPLNCINKITYLHFTNKVYVKIK